VDSESPLRQTLIAQRVIPVLRLESAERTERAVECLTEAGFGAFEITLTTPDAVDLIRRLSARYLVGAGTVLKLAEARDCIDAGAGFLVSPCIVPDLAHLAHEAQRVVMMGGFSPGEILEAHREGSDVVKVFPASSGGPQHLRAIHAVFPWISLCPTGGLTLENFRDYLAAGAELVGIGNDMLDTKALAAGDRGRVVAQAKRFLR
jgi:2-dehydro-3-deoxyphosphogluconate aldolase / (4S)-4-hydroxy-2-oxoglutarate aldolase